MLSEERRSAIGRNICEARQRQGMTQAKLAEVTGAAVEVIAHAESGDDEISLEMLLEICSATGTLPDDILAGAYVINDAGKDLATSEAAHQGEENFSVADVSPEDRELLDHIVYFMAHKKPAR